MLYFCIIWQQLNRFYPPAKTKWICYFLRRVGGKNSNKIKTKKIKAREASLLQTHIYIWVVQGLITKHAIYVLEIYFSNLWFILKVTARDWITFLIWDRGNELSNILGSSGELYFILIFKIGNLFIISGTTF